ncbi:hypothetical protein I3843_03G211500 [Carya illinoinensis]|nr:hypothetical protein I3843_03G211500 [Carya illinoinensis]KAG7988905.1 hypothetical protein I3843_03G211500 [Carya illinoinensis]
MGLGDQRFFPDLFSSWQSILGEKLLNNPGGMRTKAWKAKNTREITGPITTGGFDLGLPQQINSLF